MRKVNEKSYVLYYYYYFSYLSRWRCHYCHSRRSLQHPLKSVGTYRWPVLTYSCFHSTNLFRDGMTLILAGTMERYWFELNFLGYRRYVLYRFVKSWGLWKHSFLNISMIKSYEYFKMVLRLLLYIVFKWLKCLLSSSFCMVTCGFETFYPNLILNFKVKY